MRQYNDQPDTYGEGRRRLDGAAFPSRVVAVVDQGLCGVAAVRRAIPLAAPTGQPLTVLIVKPALSSFVWLTGLTVLPWWADDIETEILASVAAEFAASPVRWNFDVLGPGSRLDLAGDGRVRDDDIVVVVANHWADRFHRRLWPPGRVRAPAAARRSAASLLVVDCDRGARTRDRATRRRWWHRATGTGPR